VTQAITSDGITPRGLELDRAYAACRAIARREAKNFYYAFIALPAPRRNAICAIYAFMRKADDLADDESLSRDERRRSLTAWLAEWRAVCQDGSTADPVFLAVRDCTARFQIPLNLLDELVAGVTMDLDQRANLLTRDFRETEANSLPLSTKTNSIHSVHQDRCVAEVMHFSTQGAMAENDVPDTYATFADLYRYCYLVASVVGLVCIRIFGYTDPRAEKLAEETGIAFQLTNILRDVAEDAARNRVYLPLEDLAAHNVSLDSLLHRAPAAQPTAGERALLAAIAQRAEEFYKSAQLLLPMIDCESRPALWVLVAIYHGLLERIERADYDVFSRRASVPLLQKLGILAVGLTRIGWARLFA
jgi:phytoene synthase